MYLPPLQAIQDSRICINGDVTIHPSAAIAPGVLLQANPGSQIIVGAGACIGMGAVLHAHEGILTIQEGASLGAGVLIVGNGEVGSNACIGASSTLINCSVPAHVLVPPGSLLGDRSRQVQLEPGPEIKTSPALKAPQAVRSLAPETEPASSQPKTIASPTPASTPISNSPISNSPISDSLPIIQPQPAPPNQLDAEEPISTYVYPENRFELSPNVVDEPEDEEPASPPFVHGQAYVVNLLSTLLPNRANSTASGPNP